jgi:hypothetical protein
MYKDRDQLLAHSFNSERAGLAVSYSIAGVCSNVDATFTMTSGTRTCTV